MAILAVADGSVFHGRSIGASGMQYVELVFNTAMTGYQEILTDPSYSQQIVTMTCSHISNTDVNDLDVESHRIHASGLVVCDHPNTYSSWQTTKSLNNYLIENNIIGISDIDTRELTRRLRTYGRQNACLMVGQVDEVKAIQATSIHPSMEGQDLSDKVSIERIESWIQASVWDSDSNTYLVIGDGKYHVVVYDCGVKHNILRLLAHHGRHVTLVPANTPAQTVLNMKPDAVFLANSPSDPEPLIEQIEIIKVFIKHKLPLLGICLGQQLLALARDNKIIKMKHGYYGANYPVQDLDTGKVITTSQNHGFTADELSLSNNVKLTHRSLFDGTLQGVAFIDAPIFDFQGHPEVSSGHRGSERIFVQFIKTMQ